MAAPQGQLQQVVELVEPPNECCRNPENRGPVEHLAGSLSFERCQVCGCRHFLLVVDPGVIGAEGQAL